MLKGLVAIANRLDQLRLTKEADYLDRIINKLAQSKLPHDEEDVDADFEKYLAEGNFEDEPMDDTDPEEAARLQLDALTQMLNDGRLSEDQVRLISQTVSDLKFELEGVEEQPAWGGDMLPVAEAKKK